MGCVRAGLPANPVGRHVSAEQFFGLCGAFRMAVLLPWGALSPECRRMLLAVAGLARVCFYMPFWLERAHFPLRGKSRAYLKRQTSISSVKCSDWFDDCKKFLIAASRQALEAAVHAIARRFVPVVQWGLLDEARLKVQSGDGSRARAATLRPVQERWFLTPKENSDYLRQMKDDRNRKMALAAALNLETLRNSSPCPIT